MYDLKLALIERIPYFKTLGFKIIEIKEGYAHFELEFRDYLTQNGVIHGGVLASMIDSTCACAAFSLVYPKGWVTTIDLQVSYLKPVSKGILTAKAKCLRSGKFIAFCESKIYNDKGELICLGTSQLRQVISKTI